MALPDGPRSLEPYRHEDRGQLSFATERDDVVLASLDGFLKKDDVVANRGAGEPARDEIVDKPREIAAAGMHVPGDDGHDRAGAREAGGHVRRSNRRAAACDDKRDDECRIAFAPSHLRTSHPSGFRRQVWDGLRPLRQHAQRGADRRRDPAPS